jgi:hypothetical protein
MVDHAELERLLSLVKEGKYNTIDGIGPFRTLLSRDGDRRVLDFLQREFKNLDGKRLAGIAFTLAEHYRQVGDVTSLLRLFANHDAGVRQYCLNALWEKSGPNPKMGPAIVQLAVASADDPSPAVRTEVSSVLQNQCAWGIDVSSAITPLRKLLSDRNERVRQQAGFAVGNIAKKKYDLAECIRQLRRNVKHKTVSVRYSAAWALWHLSRNSHEISSAVPELVWLLTDDEEYNEPRKNAVGALLHHGRKSPANAGKIKDHLDNVVLDETFNEIRKFVAQFGKLRCAP